MCVCVCVCVCVCIYIYIYIYIYINVRLYVENAPVRRHMPQAQLKARPGVHMCVCIQTYVYMLVCSAFECTLHVYVCVCVIEGMYRLDHAYATTLQAHTHTHTHTYALEKTHKHTSLVTFAHITQTYHPVSTN
jgi:hypothetical protein